MSREFLQQYPGNKGSMLRQPVIGILFAHAATTPTNGASGFAHGCKFINTAGGVGTTEYTNTGTVTSATWTNVL